MNNVAIYLRVSTTDQNIETQRQPVIDYCKRNNLKIFREYADQGVSGNVISRNQFDELQKDMRAGKFNIILVYRLDRLARSLRHLLDILAELRNRKIQLISISDGINTADDSPMSRAFFQLLGIFSELEREIIIERVKAGLDRLKRQGKILGRPKGSKDKRKRAISGYLLRYCGKTKEERRLVQRIRCPTTKNRNE